MKVHALVFEIGIESGYQLLIGLYDTFEKAENTMKEHMSKHYHSQRHYHICAIDLNKEVDITIAEW